METGLEGKDIPHNSLWMSFLDDNQYNIGTITEVNGKANKIVKRDKFNICKNKEYTYLNFIH